MTSPDKLRPDELHADQLRPETLRQQAEECLRFARETHDDDARKQFLNMANAWTLAAADIERQAAAPNVIPFLRGQGFEPEVVKNMSLAFDRVCELLGLTTKCDTATKLVAHLVIEQAQCGVQDTAALIEAVKKHFELAP